MQFQSVDQMHQALDMDLVTVSATITAFTVTVDMVRL